MTKSIMPEDKSKCNFADHVNPYISIDINSFLPGELRYKISFIEDNNRQACIRMQHYLDQKDYKYFGCTMGMVWTVLSPLTMKELIDLVEKSVSFRKMPYENKCFIERNKLK